MDKDHLNISYGLHKLDFDDQEQYSHPPSVRFKAVKYETWGDLISAILLLLIPPLRFWPSHAFDFSDTRLEDTYKKKGVSWQEATTRLILALLLTVKLPLAIFGFILEWFLNFYYSNSGLLGLFYKLMAFRISEIVLFPKQKNPSSYYSVIGWLDQRMDLINPYSSKLKINPNSKKFDYDSKNFADLCMMASKIAYESQEVQKPIVNNNWNMYYQKFYKFPNALAKTPGLIQWIIHGIIELAYCISEGIPIIHEPILKTLSEWTALCPKTYAFTFTDKPKGADLIVLAFRGTGPFNADAWSTDFEFTFLEVDETIGRLHVGFLQALGLVDKEDLFASGKQLKKNLNDPKQQLTTGLSEERIKDIMSRMQDEKEPCKGENQHVHQLLAFDKISADINKLLKENPDARLVITGHSLGGALAAMFAALVFHNKVEKGEKNLLLDNLAAIFTFGQPRIGDKVFARYMNRKLEEHKVQYYRVVYAYDLVPRVPLDDRHFCFKHFGFCCYNTILYQQKALIEQPDKNFLDVMFSMVMHAFAAWELVSGMMVNRVFYGDDFRESGMMTLSRFVGLVVPGLVAHAPTNYVNAVRLGPPRLQVVPFEDTP